MEIIIAAVAGIAVGAVASYLVLRNNPKIEAKLDTLTDKIESKLDNDSDK
jgi:uncharacterized membrane-anchored protein YhcB (DUF1043 family)